MVVVSLGTTAADVVAALRSLRSTRPRVVAAVGSDVLGVVERTLAAVGGGSEPLVADAAVPPGTLLVGLGSLDEAGVRAAGAAARATDELGVPWVLDPDTASGPLELARGAVHLLSARPAVVRATAAEVVSLGASGEQVDGVETLQRAFRVAGDLARRCGAVVAVSGEVDLVTDGERAVSVRGGDPAAARVPGIGTAVAALVAAYTTAVDDRLLAAVAAHAHAAAAAELAASAGAHGTHGAGGTDGLADFLDALGRVEEASVGDPARLA